jgi:hypothetical protein
MVLQLAFPVPRVHHDGEGPGALGALHVAERVANHIGTREIDPMLGRGPIEHPRPRLAAIAVHPQARRAHVRVMGTIIDRVQPRSLPREQPLELRVQLQDQLRGTATPDWLTRRREPPFSSRIAPARGRA